jgi:Domain of unknown function (DUF3870)
VTLNPHGRTLIFGGQARLPHELSANEVLQIIVEIEVETGKVLEADVKPCPVLIARMLKQMMIGASLPNDLNDLQSQIEGRVFYKGKKALLTALKDVVRECREYQYRVSEGSRL